MASALEGARGTPPLKPIWFISWQKWGRRPSKIYFYIFINPMTPWIVATASTSLWNTFYSPRRYAYSEGTGTASLWWRGVEDIFGLYSRSTLVWTRATQSPPKYSTWWYMWSSTTGSQRYWRRKGEAGTEVFERYIQHLAAYFYSNDSILASMRSEILQREFKALAELFKRVELFTNMGNTVSMACQHFCAIGGHYTEAYGLRIMGEGMTHQVKLHQRVRCPGCDMYLAVGLLATQLRVKHRVGS